MPKWKDGAPQFTVKAYFNGKNGSWHCTIPRPIVNLLEIKDKSTFIIDSEKGIVKLIAGEISQKPPKPTFAQLLKGAV